HVVDVGLSTTPTVEMAVEMEHADGGIILTASHNPKQWNALKLLDKNGEFLNAEAGAEILKIAESGEISFAEIDGLGKITRNDAYIDLHIEEILKLNLVDVQKIKKSKFKIVVDAVNSTGGIAVPMLLEKLNVPVEKHYCEPTGNFPHNPERLEKHLTEMRKLVPETT